MKSKSLSPEPTAGQTLKAIPAASRIEAARKPARRSDVWALTILLTGAFLSPFDYFIVNLALPAIQAGLKASAAELQLIVSVYTSAFAVFLITGGRLGDMFGRKRVFMAGMAGFVLSSLLCAGATSGIMLVVGRMLQGASASVVVPQVLATIRATFPNDQQTRVIGLYGFVYGFASVAGQLAGGALITLRPFGLGWPSIFLINVPIGVLAFLGAWRFVPESRPANGERIDLRGMSLLLLFLTLTVYPLTQGREAGWPAWTFLAFAASLPVLCLFLRVESRLKAQGGNPLIDLNLFKNPVFSIGLILAFCFYCDSVFFLTYGIYLQNGLHWTPLEAGLAILPFGVGSILGPLLSPAVVRRVGARVLALGFALLTAGFATSGAALCSEIEPNPLFYLSLLFAGTGHGMVLPSVVRIVISEIEPAKAGLASGMVTSMLQLGSAFGATAISGVFFSVLSKGTSPADYVHAYQAAIGIVSVLFVACTMLSLVLIRRQGQAHRVPRLCHNSTR